MKIESLKFKNPLMVCSGVLGISSELFKRLEKMGIGGVVSKSISLNPNEGYKNPTVFRLPYGVLNAMGLPNPGVDAFINEIKDLKLNIPLIVSIFGKDKEEYSILAEKLSGHCDALELNLSCPHAGGLLSIGQDPEVVKEVVKAAKRSSSVPIIAKLTPNVSDIAAIGKKAQDGGADAIAAINTVKGLALNVSQEHPVLSNVFGGLSGPCIKPIGIRCIWELSGAVDIPIIGVGGITDWKDVVEYLFAGASATQIGTSLGSEGIDLIPNILDGLNNYCKENKMEYKDLIGRVRTKFD